MRLHRFFIHTTIGDADKLSITDEHIIHQWKKVFRLGAGDSVVLFDGSGKEYTATIDMLSREKAELLIGESRMVQPSAKEIFLCLALIKKDNVEWAAQKATELGVSHIVPIQAMRSEKKSVVRGRLEKIVTEASEQCGRGDIPHIYEPMTLDQAYQLVSGTEKYAFDVSGSALVEAELNDPKPVSIFIGPEGGWDEQELAFFKEHGVVIKSLGSRVLRAETAVVAVSTLFLIK